MSSGEHGGLSSDPTKLKNAILSAGKATFIDALKHKLELDPNIIFRRKKAKNRDIFQK